MSATNWHPAAERPGRRRRYNLRRELSQLVAEWYDALEWPDLDEEQPWSLDREHNWELIRAWDQYRRDHPPAPPGPSGAF